MVYEYLPLIILGVSIVISYLLLQTRYKKQVAKMLLYLVSEAEAEYGAKTGTLKYSAVSTWLYERIPFGANLFLTPKMINKLIETAVDEMKSYLEKNANARSVIVNDESKV